MQLVLVSRNFAPESERNNWGNLYLYDAANGQLKSAVSGHEEGNYRAKQRVLTRSRGACGSV